MDDLIRLKELVNEHGEVPISLKMGYTVTFSTLSGNLPVNNRITGNIFDIPVKIQLFYHRIANSPVNVRAEGYIGGSKINATLNYGLTYSTAAGTIPLNNQVLITANENKYTLTIPRTNMIGSSRGAKGSAKSKKVHGGGDAKFVGGQLKQPEELASAEEGISQDTGIPIPSGLYGFIEDIEVDIRFQSSYYFDTGSGKTPINVKAVGFLRKADKAQFAY